MNRTEVIIYGGLFSVSLLLIVWLIPAFSPPHPGYGMPPSLLPNLVIGIILLLSAGKLAGIFLHRKGSADINKDAPAVLHLSNVARFIVPSLLLMPAIQYAGFIPAGLVFMFVVQYFAGQRSIIVASVVSVILVSLSYYILRYVVTVPLP